MYGRKKCNTQNVILLLQRFEMQENQLSQFTSLIQFCFCLVLNTYHVNKSTIWYIIVMPCQKIKQT
jgi:hypothetical protein